MEERQQKALVRAEELQRAIAVLALQLDRTTAELESALTDLRAASREQAPPVPGAEATAPSEAAADLPAAPRRLERRSGNDRRSSQERRQAHLGGLAARIVGATDRRSGGDRRSGTGRRADDRRPVV